MKKTAIPQKTKYVKFNKWIYSRDGENKWIYSRDGEMDNKERNSQLDIYSNKVLYASIYLAQKIVDYRSLHDVYFVSQPISIPDLKEIIQGISQSIEDLEVNTKHFKHILEAKIK